MKKMLAGAALLAAVALTAVGPAGAAEGVCTWGGTPLDPTGQAWAPGLSNHHPAPNAIPLHVEGDLGGVGASCTGTMIFDGYMLPGAQWRLFIEYGAVSGVPGVAWFFGGGGAVSRGLLYSPEGKVVGTYDPVVEIASLPDLIPKCLTPEGLTDAVIFSSTTELVPA
jgi:hypothetical protein